jgi:anthranilate synthase component I
MRLRQYPDKDTFKSMAREANVIPVFTEVLADMETPVSIMNKFYSGKGPAFLFESVEGGERWGRYSFIGTSAKCEIRVLRDVVTIMEEGRERAIAHGGNPLPVLREFMGRFRPARMPELPRFWGGLVGYLTYEMVSFFEKIPNRLPERLPIAHFFIPDTLLIFDNVRNSLFIVALAFIEDGEDPALPFDRCLEKLRLMNATMASCRTEAEPAPQEMAEKRSLTSLIPDAEYRNRVSVTKDHIRTGDIIQAVISQPYVCDDPPDPLTLYRAQRYINPSPYLFFIHLGDTVLVGSSPETMVRLENRQATLRPIAGTRPRGNTEQEDRRHADDLLKDEKERAEHLMLVDLGRNDLGRVARTATVQVTDLMVIERYSHVMHLVSNVVCEMKPDQDAWDLLAATFPAGTLSGAPKVRAMEIISELETHPRGPYGGAVGYVSFSGNMDLAITIRTACIQDGRLTVRAGAGIVEDSNPERERVETLNKAMAIRRAMDLIGA